MKKSLKQLFSGIDCTIKGEDCEITGISIDSRTLKKGDIFFALQGDCVNGNDFVDEALEKGAFAVCTESAAAAGDWQCRL